MNRDVHFLSTVVTLSQRRFFEELSWTRACGWYLAGGTALALQIGHRTSVDFDFFTQRHFKSGSTIVFFQKHTTRHTLRVIRDEPDTFDLLAQPDIHLSCFYYEYHILARARSIEGVLVASLEDIAAMKLLAISDRGKHRDFVDFYYLLQHFSLREMLRFALEKYPMCDEFLFLRGLLYFDDAECDDEKNRVVLFDHSLTWKKIKKTITDAVREYQLKTAK